VKKYDENINGYQADVTAKITDQDGNLRDVQLVLGGQIMTELPSDGQELELNYTLKDLEYNKDYKIVIVATDEKGASIEEEKSLENKHEELKELENLGLSTTAIEYAVNLDTNREITDDEIYVAKTFDDLIDKGISSENTKKLLDLSYKKGGREDLEYLMENIDSSVFQEILKDELELYEKDLIEKFIELKDPNIVKQFDTNTVKKLNVYSGIYRKAIDPNKPESYLFPKLHEKLFDKINGKYVVNFRNDGYAYISDQLRINENGELEFLYFSDILKSQKELDKKWEGSLGDFYSEIYEGECGCDLNFAKVVTTQTEKYCAPKTLWDSDITKYLEKYVVGKDTGLPYNSLGGEKWFSIDLRSLDGEVESHGDFYYEAILLRFNEIEDTDFYDMYRYCVPITNKKPTFEIICPGTDNEIVSGIDSYIYK
ncbi:MAG: hypothetical protein KAT49_02305, partial [Methanomicrobia archaeon]|nr:hypothetical protein [Methanomicrobia archaeon]